MAAYITFSDITITVNPNKTITNTHEATTKRLALFGMNPKSAKWASSNNYRESTREHVCVSYSISETKRRAYTIVHVTTASGKHYVGRGFAGGYDYDLWSAAVQNAFEEAGFRFNLSIRGAGVQAIHTLCMSLYDFACNN